MGTGFGAYVPIHIATELLSAFSVYTSYFFKVLIFSYVATQVSSAKQRQDVKVMGFDTFGT